MSNFVKKTVFSAMAAIVAVSVVVPSGAAQAQTAGELQAQIQQLLATIAQLQTQLNVLQGGPGGGIAGIPAGFTFTKNLVQGASGSDVKYLQMVLNSDSMTQVASSGAGSPGNESQYFGPLTRVAVMKFQEKYASDILVPVGLSMGTGFVGPSTRTKLNGWLAAAPTPTPAPGPTPTTPPAPPEVPPVSGNTLQVTLGSDTPASATIADEGNANMTKFWLTAGMQDVSVSTVWVTRYGLTANADIENIKILDENGVKIGSIGTLSTDNKAQLTFSPALKIAANTSKAFYIRAGILNGTAGGKTVALGINSAADISAGSATVSGTFPVKGNAFTTVALAIGTVEVMEDGALTDSTPDVGDKDVIVNTFKVVVGSTEAATIEQITIAESGSASLSDTSNIELFDVSKNVSLGTSQWTSDGKASWSGLNIVVDKGETRRFRVQLDIISGVSLTVNADLMDGSDVLMSVKGNTYGFYITPDGNDASDWTNSNDGLANANQTINNGSLATSKATSTPATGNIAQANSQKLGVFDFLVQGESIKITSLKFSFDLGTMVETEVTSVKVLDKDGKLLAGPADLSTTDVTGANSTAYEGSVTFTDTIILPIGTNPITVTANIATATSASDTIRVGIADADATDITATGMTSNNSITPTPANTEVNANTLTVKAGALKAETLTEPAAKSIAAGIQDLVFATVALNASASGEAVHVTSLTVTNTTASGADAQDVDNTELWVDLTSANSSRGDAYETRIGNAAQFDETAANTADTLAYTLTQTITVKKETSTAVAVIADLVTGATSGTHTLKISAATVTGADTGNSITATFTGSGQAMTVASAGTLTTSLDASTPSADLVLANGKDVTLAVFRLAANAVESLDLDDMDIDVTGGYKVATYKFYDGATLLGTAPGGKGSSTDPDDFNIPFTDGTLVVPGNSNKKITVKGDLYDTTTAAADNDITVQVKLNKANTTGKASGSAVNDATDRDGKAHTFFKSRPYFSVNSASPQGNLVESSNSLLAIFDVKAAAGEDVTFNSTSLLTVSLSQSINDSDGNLEVFTLKDQDGTTLDATAAGSAGSEQSSTSVTFDFTTDSFTIPAGQTKKLYVYSDTLELEDNGDAIQLWLDDNLAADKLEWGIDAIGEYEYPNIIFRGDIFAGSLVNPS
ncbi:MAG: hypothetical protein AAB567_00235 [Patescibacteria group bacterium]